MGEGERDGAREVEGDAEPVGRPFVGEGVVEPLAVGDVHEDADGEAWGEEEPLGEPDADAAALGVSVGEGVPLPDGERVTVGGCEREALAQALPRPLSEALTEGEPSGDSVGRPLGDAEGLLESDRVRVGVPDAHADAVAAAEPELLGDPVPEALAEPLTEGEPPRELEGAPLTDAEELPVSLWVSVAVPLPGAEGEGVAEKAPVGEPVAHADAVALGLPDCELDVEPPGELLAEGEPEGLCDGDAVKEGEGGALRVAGGLVEKEGEGEALRVAHALAEALPEAVFCAEVDAASVGERDCRGVAELEREGGVGRALALAEALTEALRVPRALAEALGKGAAEPDCVACCDEKAPDCVAVADALPEPLPLAEAEAEAVAVLAGGAGAALAVALAVAEGVVASTPPTLKPRLAEKADHAPPANLKLHGSAQGAACRNTGQLHVLADAAEPHLTVAAPPPWCTTSAYRVAPAGTVMGVLSVSVTHE